MWKHLEARPEIITIEEAILTCAHDAVHGAAHLSHGVLHDLDGIQSLSGLMQLLEVFDIFHTVILEKIN